MIDIKQTTNLQEYLYYLNLKNDSMNPKMWKSEEITEEFFQKIYSDYSMYLVYDNNHVIGGFFLLPHDYSYWNEEDNLKPCYYIHKLFILKEYNKKGYSPLIMDWIKQKGIEDHKEAIRLDVREYLPGLNQYYEKLGFIIQRQMKSPYSGVMNLRELKLK